MARLRGSRRPPLDIWPGFVDALSTLLLAIVFMLSVFMLAQFFMSQALSGRDEALSRLTRQIAELSDLLALERKANADLRLDTSQLSASLQTASKGREDLERRLREAEAARDALTADTGAAKSVTAEARAQVELLNQQIAALRQQLAALSAALQIAEDKQAESDKVIADLGARLNVALAAKVEELNRYRSEFFGRLREVLGDRPDVRVVGDRFVFQSEVLFASGSAALEPEGQAQLATLAQTIVEIAARIPSDVPWMLRVDGHTDRVPIATAQFPSNWELSVARALAVARFLIAQGVPPEHVAAAGFGEFQPLDASGTPDADRRNRRIELRLTDR
jgi:chemotaxis protein MotB